MFNIDDLSCCGIKEISGISSRQDFTESFIQFIGEQGFYPATKGDKGFCRFLLFSQASKTPNPVRGYGERFQKWIRDHKFGKVTSTGGDVKNPNSGNYLKIYVWTVDWEAIRKWFLTDSRRLERLSHEVW